MKNLIIIGDGVAGDTAARKIVTQPGEFHVSVFTAEKFPFYQRTRVGDVLSGDVKPNDLILHDRNWYSDKEIDLHLDTPVENIFPSTQTISTASGEQFGFDKLLLATGAKPIFPGIEGKEKEGIYTLRTLADAADIRSDLEHIDSAVVIGGGILGLESAYSLNAMGITTTVVEILPLVMGKQLDKTGSKYVRKRLEKKGIRFRLGCEAVAFLGGDRVEKVELDTGEVISAESVVVSAGVSPRTELAEAAGLETGRGILVDDQLRTSDENVYAAGDAIEQNGNCYGIWPPAREQGDVAGGNLAGEKNTYDGSLNYFKLKVAEIDLISAGIRKESLAGEIVTRKEGNQEDYKKFFLDEGARLIGVIAVGDVSTHSTILNALRKREELKTLEEKLEKKG